MKNKDTTSMNQSMVSSSSLSLCALRLLIAAIATLQLWSVSVSAFSPHPLPTLLSSNNNNNNNNNIQSSSFTSFTSSSTITTITTKVYSSNLNEEDFMASLNNRINQIEKSSNTLPLVVLDSMLPRQILKIKVANKLLIELVRHQIASEKNSFGMLGLAIMKSGDKINLTTGVLVEMMERPIFEMDDNTGVESVFLVLQATKRFKIVGDIQNSKEEDENDDGSSSDDGGDGWTQATVQYLDSETEEQEQLQQDKLTLARAISKAKTFTTPNANVSTNHSSLLQTWITLAKSKERTPGQISTLLESLGDIPNEDKPTERALWVGALINPIPAMGVAMEIRPALLTAQSAEEKVEIAAEGLLRSIKHMDGSAPMW